MVPEIQGLSTHQSFGCHMFPKLGCNCVLSLGTLPSPGLLISAHHQSSGS